jgi:hypothetical protein
MQRLWKAVDRWLIEIEQCPVRVVVVRLYPNHCRPFVSIITAIEISTIVYDSTEHEPFSIDKSYRNRNREADRLPPHHSVVLGSQHVPCSPFCSLRDSEYIPSRIGHIEVYLNETPYNSLQARHTWSVLWPHVLSIDTSIIVRHCPFDFSIQRAKHLCRLFHPAKIKIKGN